MLLRLSFTLLLAFASCTARSPASAPGEPSLTDEQVRRYVEACRALREAGPKLADRLIAGEQVSLEAARQDFGGVEDLVRRAGFPGYAEFARTNSRIAWAFSTAQGRSFLEDFAGRMSEGEKELQAALDDPGVPEEVKREVRAQLKTMKEVSRNKKWANVAGTRTDPDSVEVLLRHRPELEAVFLER